MPIVGEGKDVHVEYHMPENIKKLVTDEFLKEFRDQLFRIHGYYKLDAFAEYSVPVNTGTGGYSAAFFKACMLTGSEELYNYSRTLHGMMPIYLMAKLRICLLIGILF